MDRGFFRPDDKVREGSSLALIGLDPRDPEGSIQSGSTLLTGSRSYAFNQLRGNWRSSMFNQKTIMANASQAPGTDERMAGQWFRTWVRGDKTTAAMQEQINKGISPGMSITRLLGTKMFLDYTGTLPPGPKRDMLMKLVQDNEPGPTAYWRAVVDEDLGEWSDDLSRANQINDPVRRRQIVKEIVEKMNEEKFSQFREAMFSDDMDVLTKDALSGGFDGQSGTPEPGVQVIDAETKRLLSSYPIELQPDIASFQGPFEDQVESYEQMALTLDSQIAGLKDQAKRGYGSPNDTFGAGNFDALWDKLDENRMRMTPDVRAKFDPFYYPARAFYEASNRMMLKNFPTAGEMVPGAAFGGAKDAKQKAQDPYAFPPSQQSPSAVASSAAPPDAQAAGNPIPSATPVPRPGTENQLPPVPGEQPQTPTSQPS
jgi:hypothetical protein